LFFLIDILIKIQCHFRTPKITWRLKRYLSDSYKCLLQRAKYTHYGGKPLRNYREIPIRMSDRFWKRASLSLNTSSKRTAVLLLDYSRNICSGYVRRETTLRIINSPEDGKILSTPGASSLISKNAWTEV